MAGFMHVVPQTASVLQQIGQSFRVPLRLCASVVKKSVDSHTLLPFPRGSIPGRPRTASGCNVSSDRETAL
jgi:hypothetical protein